MTFGIGSQSGSDYSSATYQGALEALQRKVVLPSEASTATEHTASRDDKGKEELSTIADKK